MTSEEMLFFNYLSMPDVYLIGLLNQDYKKVLEIELNIVEDWIENERCECCNNPLIKNKKISLDCEHLNEKIKEKIKEIEKGIEIKSNALKLKNLCHSERFRQRLHTFKI